MITYPEINPIIVQLGPLAIRWYGLMYMLSFLLGWPLLQRRAQKWMPELTLDMLNDLILWIVLGVVIGGRLGYVLFYNAAYYLSTPLALLHIWEGGMSFHGGLIGVLFAGWLFSKRRQLSFLRLADTVIPVIPIGLLLGRIGNFINGELWGRTTDLPWGMVFPGAGPYPRHPSQIYEAILEGMLLFTILWIAGQKARPTGWLLGLFFICYAGCRFLVEFVREPDVQLGYLAFGLTMGQWLTVPMVLIGFWLLSRGRA